MRSLCISLFAATTLAAQAPAPVSGTLTAGQDQSHAAVRVGRLLRGRSGQSVGVLDKTRTQDVR
jgi:hypothetical protein